MKIGKEITMEDQRIVKVRKFLKEHRGELQHLVNYYKQSEHQGIEIALLESLHPTIKPNKNAKKIDSASQVKKVTRIIRYK
jgi:hypothetical protein